ncbi:MAG: hypothetical protein ABIH42_00745 [Planctomycetota bacterium]
MQDTILLRSPFARRERHRKRFSGNEEVSHFVKTLKPLLASAMSLRGIKVIKEAVPDSSEAD